MTLPSNTRDSHPRLFVDDVWYIIISILHPEHCGENEGDKSPDYWKAKEPSKHPPDLGDLLSLSSTCTYFRDLLGPRIFETLYLRNTRKSALSVQAVADGRFSVCVKVLRFIGTYRVSSSLDELCLPEVINVLSNLTRFGSLQHLSIRFPFDDDDISGPHSMEREVKWRSLIALSFFAVVDSYQSSPPPRSLEMQDLNIIAIPTITPPKSWTVFRQLKALNVTLQSPSEGLRRNVIKSIKAFQVDFDYSIFNNLRSVEELTFNPFDAIHMGQVEEELRYTHDIGLGSARMPSLRKVTFANIFICGELCNFLLRHLGTLDQSPSGIATPTHSTSTRMFSLDTLPHVNSADELVANQTSSASPGRTSFSRSHTRIQKSSPTLRLLTHRTNLISVIQTVYGLQKKPGMRKMGTGMVQNL
ncbi:hypothetical protein BJX99DRAFT_226529 [Aspergillus californicus]